jgi:hypothetical protein
MVKSNMAANMAAAPLNQAQHALELSYRNKIAPEGEKNFEKSRFL